MVLDITGRQHAGVFISAPYKPIEFHVVVSMQTTTDICQADKRHECFTNLSSQWIVFDLGLDEPEGPMKYLARFSNYGTDYLNGSEVLFVSRRWTIIVSPPMSVHS